MKTAIVYFCNRRAAVFTEHSRTDYELKYDEDYKGPPISLTLPVRKESYRFGLFPTFFEGLLPEGIQLEALLRQRKINRTDFFSQLMAVGNDLVGAVSVRQAGEER